MGEFAHAFATIDLSRPWLVPFLPIHQAFGEALAQTKAQTDWHDGALARWLNGYFSVNNFALNTHTGQALTFTAQSTLPHGTAYERFIYEQQQIPTRDNLHDWFGACIWATFPRTKALLNAKHLAHMAQESESTDKATGNARNRVRDTITVFDENGAM